MAVTFGFQIDDFVANLAEVSRAQLEKHIKAAIQKEADAIVAAAAKEITQQLQTYMDVARDPLGGSIAQFVIVDKRPRSDG